MKRLVLLSLILSLVFLGAGVVEIGPGARISQYDQSSNVNFSQARNFSSIGVRSLLTDFGSSNFTVKPENSASAELEFYRPFAGRQNYVSNFTGYASPRQQVSFNISDLPSEDFYEAFFSKNDTRIFIGYADPLQSFDFNLSLSSADISVYNYGEKGVAIDNITFNDSSPVEGEKLGVEEEIFNEGVVDDEAVNKTLRIYTYNGSAWEQKQFRSEDLAVPVNSTETEQSFTAKFEGSFTNTTQYRNGGGQLGLGYQNGTSGDSLVGYWRMDQAVSGSGGTVTDYSGENNDGTTKNGVTTGVTGTFSTDAFDFDGTDDQVDIPDPSTDLTNFTVSAWVLFKSGAANEHAPLVEKNGVSKENYPAPVDIRTSRGGFPKDLETKYGQGGTANTLSATDAFEQGKWYHVAIAADNTAGGVAYIDGVQVDSNSKTGLDDEQQKIILAQRLDQLGHANVKLDEVRIYNRSLSSSEVKDLYFHGAPFHGNYTTKKIDNDKLTHWYRVNLDANIPSGTSLEAEFRALDSSGKVVGTDSFSVRDGNQYYNVSVPDSEDAELYLNGSSDNLTKSWEVNQLQVISGGPYVDEWEVKPGPWRFNVSMDPNDNVKETNESNNDFSELLDVPSYQVFYGDSDSPLLLGAQDRDLYRWDPVQDSGFIFFYDADSEFSYSDLQPVNGSDLQDLNRELKVRGHNDSIRGLWDRNGDGSMDRKESWKVGSRTLQVPVTNSTEDSPFDTGILYDSGDGAGYDGTQDLVFMTKIEAEKSGSYGVYDYEARIPFSLEELRPGSDLITIDSQLS